MTSRTIVFVFVVSVFLAACGGDAINTAPAGDAAGGGEAVAATMNAVCVLVPTGDGGVSGVVHFAQQGRAINVTGEVTGLTPGKHGFHVHELGDLTAADGTSTGGHYNPMGVDHGAPDSDVRHVGDLGNIEADANGTATIDMTDSVIALSGPHSIIGRGIIVHAKPDDFGQPTGNAGARVAAGVIGIAKAPE